MVVTLALHQVTSVQEGPLYRVLNEVTCPDGSADPAVFVFSTATQEFNHYAAVADMQYPATYEEALQGNIAFYRQTKVQRDWASVALMQEDLQTTQRRLRFLAEDLSVLSTDIVIDQTTTISAGE